MYQVIGIKLIWKGHKNLKHNSSLTLPAFINEIYHKGTEDEQNEQRNEHVVDGPDVIHLKKLTVDKQQEISVYIAAMTFIWS